MINLIKALFGAFKKQQTDSSTPALHISENCIDVIKYYEGLKLEAYQDVGGVWTIGYGDTKGVHKNMHITQEQAEERLINRIANEFEPQVLNMLKTSVTQGELDALVSFAYNLGAGALQGSTLLRKLNGGDNNGAYNEFTRWIHVGKKPYLGLLRRRVTEQALFKGHNAANAIAKGQAVKSL